LITFLKPDFAVKNLVREDFKSKKVWSCSFYKKEVIINDLAVTKIVYKFVVIKLL